MYHAQSVSLDEVLLAFSRCVPFPEPVRVGAVKRLILTDRFGSFDPYASRYSLENTVQRMVEIRCAERSGGKTPYYFESTQYGLYQLTDVGRARLSKLLVEDQVRQQVEKQKQKDEDDKRREAEQRSFLTSRVETPNPPEVAEFNGRRFVRDYPAANTLKEIYGYSCQVCGVTIATPDSGNKGECGYAEVHHIRPLGSGHGGPDYPGNMLVVCPNHHAGFDLSGMAIKPDSLEVYYLEPDGGVYKKGPLSLLNAGHEFDPECLRHAWELWLRNLSENGLDITEAELD